MTIETDEQIKAHRDTDPECQQYFKQHKDGPDWKVHRSEFVDLSVSQFFDEFHNDQPAYSFVDVSHACNFKNPVLYPWKEGSRRNDCVVPVEGVPFINETRCHRFFKLIKKD